MEDKGWISALQTEDQDIIEYFDIVSKIMRRYFNADKSDEILKAYLENYAKESYIVDSDYDNLWLPMLHNENEYWQAQFILGSPYIKQFFTSYWQPDYMTLEDFDQSSLPPDYAEFMQSVRHY